MATPNAFLNREFARRRKEAEAAAAEKEKKETIGAPITPENRRAALRDVGPNSAAPRHADPYRGMSPLEKTAAMEAKRKEGVDATRAAVKAAQDADPETQKARRMYGETTPGEQTERGRRSRFGV